MIYVGEGDNHPGLYRRALRIAPGELHWIDPLRELKTGESVVSMSVSATASRCKERNSSSVRTRPTCFSTNLSVESRRGQFAAWYDGDELVGSGVIAE